MGAGAFEHQELDEWKAVGTGFANSCVVPDSGPVTMVFFEGSLDNYWGQHARSCLLSWSYQYDDIRPTVEVTAGRSELHFERLLDLT